jgi:hypothetical protein
MATATNANATQNVASMRFIGTSGEDVQVRCVEGYGKDARRKSSGHILLHTDYRVKMQDIACCWAEKQAQVPEGCPAQPHI